MNGRGPEFDGVLFKHYLFISSGYVKSEDKMDFQCHLLCFSHSLARWWIGEHLVYLKNELIG